MDMPSYDSIHEIRVAPSLVIVPLQSDDGGEVGVYEFISKSFARCPINVLYWLSYFKQPKSLTKAFFDHPSYGTDVLRDEVNALLDAKFLLNSPQNEPTDTATFDANWEWDLSTALFHFTAYDNPFMSDADARQKQVSRLEVDPPPLFWWGPSQTDRIAFPATADESPMLSVMQQRRTNRTSTHGSIDQGVIARCLYAGLGIVGTMKATSGDVPLKMTPSGGARNPYEAFVIIRRGKDIDPGVYHYCAAEQVLEKVSSLDPDLSLSNLFGGQDWVDEMSVVIVLVAVFERTMWKYQDPNAYRVLLIEAGHIAQNMMLMATEQAHTMCPTAAMTHSKVSDLLGLKNRILHVPVYALSLDKALPSDVQIRPVLHLERESPLW